MPSRGVNEGVHMLGELVCDASTGKEEFVEHPQTEQVTPPTIQSLGLDKLPRDVRIALVQELWDSIVAEGTRPISDARRQELARRADEDDASSQMIRFLGKWSKPKPAADFNHESANRISTHRQGRIR